MDSIREMRRTVSTHPRASLAVTLVLICLPMGICSCRSRYQSLLLAGKKQLPCVADFADLYPDSRHLITYMTGEMGPPTWTSTAGIDGRYILRMEIRVTPNKLLSGFSGSAAPEFTLQEISRVSVDSLHRPIVVEPGNTSLKFGFNKWKKLVVAKGDLSVLGITEIKDQPVQNFDASWQEGSGEKMPKE